MSVQLPLFLMLFLGLSSLAAAALTDGKSVYTTRIADPRAIYLTPDNFPVHADGVADDTEAIQQAIDKVSSTTRQGILFIPEGRYRISKTLHVWPGIRLIG
ncbi:MAG TPA: glycosyl hydrolase family 28-related protein, partial [Fimbriimonas sp.]|nr:glycosyl hydrolase family 28-related protein [Fimbriimonas sp.]